MRLLRGNPFLARLHALAFGTALLCNVYVDDYYRDNGLGAGATGSSFRFCLLNAEADTYTEAITTFNLGNKNAPTSALADGTGGGRAIQITGFSDGSVSANGTASHWAWVDVTNTRLISSGALSASQVVTSGNTFTITTFQAARFADAA